MARATKSRPAEGKTNITIPRARRGEDETYFVSINGTGYQIPRGKEVTVPDFVAAEIERSQEAEEMMFEDKERRLAEANKLTRY